MPTIFFEIYIEASPASVFDLARSVEAHVATTSKTNERAVAGVTSGLLVEGDTVTWEANHLGFRQRLTAQISEMDRPHYFIDKMVSGAFQSFTHRHEFEAHGTGMVMRDWFTYISPLGMLGKLADRLFLKSYMQKFIEDRARALKDIAENRLSVAD